MQTHTSIHTHADTHKHAHTQAYTHAGTHMHAHTQAYTHMHAHTHMQAHTQAYTHTSTHACTHACTHMHTRIHTCIHTHKHTHTHTHTNTHTNTRKGAKWLSRCYGKRPLKLQLVFQLLHTPTSWLSITKKALISHQTSFPLASYPGSSPIFLRKSLGTRLLSPIRGWGLGTMILQQSTPIKAHLGCRLLGQCWCYLWEGLLVGSPDVCHGGGSLRGERWSA